MATLDWFNMNSTTCAALTALFPLVMITAVLERREIAIKLRLRGWFRRILLTIVGASIIGLVFAVAGTQAGELRGLTALAAWATATISVLGMGTVFILASMASTELAEDRARPPSRDRGHHPLPSRSGSHPRHSETHAQLRNDRP